VSFEQQPGACERKYESEGHERPDRDRDQIEAVATVHLHDHGRLPGGEDCYRPDQVHRRHAGQAPVAR
jgi:hypothetical protein